VIEDLGEYTPEPEPVAAASEEESEELPPEVQEEYMELLTTPDSVDAGSKLIQ